MTDVGLTAAERDSVDRSLADTGCHGFAGDHPELYEAVARIKVEAVQAERERIALLFEDRHGWGNVGPIAARLVRGEGS